MSAICRQMNVVILFFFTVWIILLLVFALPMLSSHPSNGSQDVSTRLEKALTELEELRRQNNELQELFRDIKLGDFKEEEREAIESFQKRLTKVAGPSKLLDNGFVSQKEEPNTQYELLRRRISTNTQELWYLVNSAFKRISNQIQSYAPELVPDIENFIKSAQEHKQSLLHDIDQLAEADGFATWRELESNDLSNLIQKRLQYLQNPPDCESAKKIVCNINKGCGFGCQLHHVVFCFLIAYGTERTLILRSKGWKYNKGGWEEKFHPISETCTSTYDAPEYDWPGKDDNQVLRLPVIDSISPRPPFLPPAIPDDLAPRLIRMHGDPTVWWIGQFMKYLLKPQEKTAAALQKTMVNMGFQRPIVGVHVRRTDKVGTEASFHSIDEYMEAVNEYYNQLELKQKIDKRRIYLATDDPKVIVEARKKYPHYDILGDATVSKTAAVSTRYSESSLDGIISDIHMLAMSDYLVCTFSSQVCRAAYEIMQTYYPDAAGKFRSLDDIYYYGGQNAHNRVAVLPHAARSNAEISFEVGDLIGVAGNHWDGYSKGKHVRTKQTGLYPSFKVIDKVETAKFPTYPKATEKTEEDV